MGAAVLLALTAAAAWGVADFVAGTTSRRVAVSVVLVVSLVAGAVAALALVVGHGTPMPRDPRLLLAVLAGVVATLELGLLYLAMRRGPLLVVAPIAALGAALPVAVGIATGDHASLPVLVGIACALGGAIAAAWGPDDEPTSGALVAAAIGGGAALSTGLALVLLDAASAVDPYWATAGLQLGGVVSGLVVLGAPVLRTIRRTPPSPRQLGLAGVVGVANVAGDVAYATATRSGSLSVVAVLSSLYPLTTIVLAAVILRERPLPLQLAGAALALVGIALLAGAGG